MQKVLTQFRFIILIAVLGCFLVALACLVIGGVEAFTLFAHILQVGLGQVELKGLVASLFEIVDLFLIGVVFYIVSMGLYELFIDDRLNLPGWLVMRNLNDLKAMLINGMVMVMLIFFLGNLLKWDGSPELLWISLPIFLIILALTIFQRSNHAH